jgi:hypothetical protein
MTFHKCSMARVAQANRARSGLCLRFELSPTPRPRVSTEAVQTPARVNVTCVTPLGEEVASIA